MLKANSQCQDIVTYAGQKLRAMEANTECPALVNMKGSSDEKPEELMGDVAAVKQHNVPDGITADDSEPKDLKIRQSLVEIIKDLRSDKEIIKKDEERTAEENPAKNEKNDFDELEIEREINETLMMMKQTYMMMKQTYKMMKQTYYGNKKKIILCSVFSGLGVITGLALVVVAAVFGSRACILSYKKSDGSEDSTAAETTTIEVEEEDKDVGEGYTSYNPSMHVPNMENEIPNGHYMNRHA